MKSMIDLKKYLKRKKTEMEKAEKDYYKSKVNAILKNAILDNEALCEKIGTMPSDEALILLKEITKSDKFLADFDCENENNTKLKRIRASKAAKAERRKAKKAQEMQSEQTDIPKDTEPFGDAFSSESNGTEEAVPQSEQAELSEQNMQSDSFVHTSAEMPTDFSQKWDQVNSLEQTDPPSYTGSIY